MKGLTTIVLISLLFVNACATRVERLHTESASTAASCYEMYDALLSEVKSSGRFDASTKLIEDFPYLRTNRFLSVLPRDTYSDKEQQLFADRLHQLALSSFKQELMQLDASDQANFNTREVVVCGETLLDHLHQSPDLKASLYQRLEVDNEYSLTNRLSGMYPFYALGVMYGVKQYHEDTQALFTEPKRDAEGMWVYVTPEKNTPSMTQLEVKRILDDSCSRDGLGIPTPTSRELDKLYKTFAPVWKIDVVDEYDLPGTPYWDDEESVAQVDTKNKPIIYTSPSYTVWQGEVLLQLNYTLWLSKRPSRYKSDPLAGHMDGMTWRVTLGRDGVPLIYDTIHNCGCYHMFFPSADLQWKNLTEPYQEDALVAAKAPSLGHGERIILSVNSASHYLEAIDKGAIPVGVRYQLADYAELKALPHPDGGYKSLFNDEGLVDGTERIERFFFWPSGVKSAGAMRVLGTHATAFVGERHFDDPSLLERNFVPTQLEAKR